MDAHRVETSVCQGEFECKQAYVAAQVEICDGVVRKIVFRSRDGESIPGAQQMIALVEGQPVGRVLEFKPEQLEAVEDSDARAALFEAFHRAVEYCIDDE